jgi:hypothetical protein
MSGDALFGQVAGTLLAQLCPAFSTTVTAFVASTRTEITRIRVTNVSGVNRTFRVHHQDTGGAATNAGAIYYDKQVLSSDVFDWASGSPNAGISMAKNAVLLVRSDLTSGLSFSIYGIVDGSGR